MTGVQTCALPISGKSAAYFVRKKLKENGPLIKIEPGKGIKYIVPHLIRTDNLNKSLQLFMRVREVYPNSRLIVKADNEVIKKSRKMHMTPGEMDNIRIDPKILQQRKPAILSVQVKKEEE